jgi:hypothetical protein
VLTRISVLGCILDFALALIPATVIWGLQKSRNDKIMLSVLLGLGIIPSVFAAVRISVMVKQPDWTDPTWQSYWMWFWVILERELLIILGCAPALKPLWDKLHKGKPLSGVGGSHNTFSLASFRFRSLGSGNRTKSRTDPRTMDGTTDQEWIRAENNQPYRNLEDAKYGMGPGNAGNRHDMVESGYGVERDAESIPDSNISLKLKDPTSTKVREGV